MEVINLSEMREAARAALSGMAWDYYASGARDEITLEENRAAFRRIRLSYRVLEDVGDLDPSVRLLGHDLALPVLAAPTAFHGLADPAGEVATARAVTGAGTVMILSTLSNRPVEEVTEAADGPVWFQLYVYRDREATEAIVRRAEGAGCSAIVVTVDAPVMGTRERDVRNRFRLPEGMTMGNLPPGMDTLPEEDRDSGLASYVASRFEPGVDESDLEWLTDVTELPVLVKGIVHPADARRSLARGAAGVVVSNHGGRQLDTAPATVDALPAVAEAVGDEGAVLVDGGVRRGTDVVKALARGADAVAVGRPVLWGLAAGGREGVERVFELLRQEVSEALALCGCRTPEEVGPDLLFS